MYVFLDLETTGLDPDCDNILQIAIQCTDKGLNELGSPFVHDVALTDYGAGRLYRNPFVHDMHRKTGLLDRLEYKIRHPGTVAYDGIRIKDLTQVEQRACAYLSPARNKLTLAGNSVHFDLAFLRRDMPRLAAMFSHRLMDVSVLRMFEEAYGAGAIDVNNANEHDALADVRCSIDQLRAYVRRRKLLAQYEMEAIQ